MVIDTSAVVAILTGEPEQRAYLEAIDRVDLRLMGVATFVESSIVLEARYGPGGLVDFDEFLDEARIEVVELDRRQALEARRAFSRYGRGHHPAGLNFGDCFSYALARVRGQPLLFKGDDLAKTDIAAAA